ncbi:MAG: helix-turn-helix transcriptional regulator [Bacteroidales bacterium]|jgi:transcriptional regulator with XRE-family HTH domain|nr:helix-turn-helix transcriptional regulator [Bacteroidales bacterium]
MKDRILEFLRRENKTSAQMAEDIRVQPSGISHILSGRNKPSLDFILKMLEKYPFLSTEWLLFGKGSMYREPTMGDLFAGMDLDQKPVTKEITPENRKQPESAFPAAEYSGDEMTDARPLSDQRVVRIVWFYNDNTFEEFFPVKH